MSIASVERVGFKAATRVNQSLTAAAERRVLLWMAERTPRWVTSDGLTALGFGAQVAAGLFYAIARWHPQALIGVILCTILNWLGDSLDGTLARVRAQQRPRYGFYVDHMVDILGGTAMMAGLGASGVLHWQTALAMLIAFLLLSSESYLATYTLGSFQLSQGIFGPTEIRVLLIIGNVALLHSRFATVFRHKLLLFDLGGTIAAVGMFAMVLGITIRNTKKLYQQEPLP